MYGVCFPTRGVSEGFHEGLYKEKTNYTREPNLSSVSSICKESCKIFICFDSLSTLVAQITVWIKVWVWYFVDLL